MSRLSRGGPAAERTATAGEAHADFTPTTPTFERRFHKPRGGCARTPSPHPGSHSGSLNAELKLLCPRQDVNRQLPQPRLRINPACELIPSLIDRGTPLDSVDGVLAVLVLKLEECISRQTVGVRRYPKKLRRLMTSATSGGTMSSQAGSLSRIFWSTSREKIERYRSLKWLNCSMQPRSTRYS